MRHILITATLLGFAVTTSAQTEATPAGDLRATLAGWVDAMGKIQREEDDWARDEEVLRNYREGLEREIADLRERIADARTRKDGADKESLELSATRDQYATARDAFATDLRRMEREFGTILGIIPPPLRSEPRVAQLTEEFQQALALPEDKATEGLSKRLVTLINLISEVEKFQQTVVVRPELHQAPDGREFNMQVVYFGLAVAYAVNQDGDFALVGRPSPNGWTHESRPELAGDIRRLLAAILGDAEAAFIELPFSLE